MSDELFCAQNNPDSLTSETQIAGVTRQVTSLARALDRLPPGMYFIELEKSTRLDAWHVMVKNCMGEPVREMDLRSEAATGPAPVESE